MWIRNWEHLASSGLPISGATVEARLASLTSPNTGSVVASTTTDPNGMWEFTSLADQAHDIKVIAGGSVWWHKGMTKHSVDAIFYVTPTPRTDQFLRNGGFEATTGNGIGPWTITADAPLLDSWRANSGAGSTATVSRDTTVHAADSAASAKVVYTKVAGQFVLYQNLPIPASYRGKQVTMSAQIRQGVASNVALALFDGVGSTLGSGSASTGTFVTLTVTRTINAAASQVTAEIVVNNSDTVYIDNVVFSLGAVASTYQPEYWYPGAVTPDVLQDWAVLTDKIADLAVTNAKLASGAVVANLGFTPINKAGDTGIGNLVSTGTLTAYGLIAADGGVNAGAGGLATTGPIAISGTNVFDSSRNLTPATYAGGSLVAGEPAVLGLNVGAHGIAAAGPINPTSITASGQISAASYAGGSTTAGVPQVLGLIVGGGGIASDAIITIGGQAVYYPGNPPPTGAGAGVPSGLGAWVPTAAAIPVAWSRYNPLNGRYPIGAGTTFSQTFTENTDYGASWTHRHTGNSFSVSVSGSATGGPSDNTGGPSSLNGLASAGGVNLPVPTHTHSLNGVSLAVSATGSASGDTSDTTWLQPSHAVVWITKN